MQRRLRVWRLLPPRKSRGALSSMRTLAPRSRAQSAAHRAAFPPPATRTSYLGNCSATLLESVHRKSGGGKTEERKARTDRPVRTGTLATTQPWRLGTWQPVAIFQAPFFFYVPLCDVCGSKVVGEEKT